MMRDPKGFVVMVLAVAIGITLIVLAAGAIWAPVAFQEVSGLLDTIGSAIVGALAVWLGTGKGEPPLYDPNRYARGGDIRPLNQPGVSGGQAPELRPGGPGATRGPSSV